MTCEGTHALLALPCQRVQGHGPSSDAVLWNTSYLADVGHSLLDTEVRLGRATTVFFTVLRTKSLRAAPIFPAAPTRKDQRGALPGAASSWLSFRRLLKRPPLIAASGAMCELHTGACFASSDSQTK